MRVSLASILIAGALLSGAQPASAINSAGTGDWSQTGTWVGGVIPNANTPVAIMAGHVVTVDITTATASTTTISGTLSFSRVASSSLTIFGGNVEINSGGTLDLGTESSPIPASVKAALVLATGTVAGEFGLINNIGGVFSVRGSTKSVWTTATADAGVGATTLTVDAANTTGWQSGDLIVIGKTSRSASDENELRVIGSIAGPNITLAGYNGAAASLLFDHKASSLVVVANLSRNALVLSTTTQPSYILSHATTLAGFLLKYGECAGLGTSSLFNRAGIFIDAGGQGQIYGSSARGGYFGYALDDASATITNNVAYANHNNIYATNESTLTISGNIALSAENVGLVIEELNGAVISGNFIVGNRDAMAIWGGRRNLVRANRFIASQQTGLSSTLGTTGNDYNRFESNSAYNNFHAGYTQTGNGLGNTWYANSSSGNMRGMFIVDDNTDIIIADDRYFANANNGIFFVGSAWSRRSHVVNTYIYGHSGPGIDLEGASTATVMVGGALGYSPTGEASPNATAEIRFLAAGAANDLTLKRVRVNPSSPNDLAGMDREGAFLASYNQSFDSGTLRVWGDFKVSGSTLSLQQADEIYLSTATRAKVMFGSSLSAISVTTTTPDAVSQLITIVYRAADASWHVIGSSSGELGTFSGNITDQPFPSSSPQFRLTATFSGAQDGHMADFALIAGSGDSGRQKRLIVGAPASGFNGGRSKITAAPGAGIVLRGVSGAHTLVDMAPGATYYSILSSGAFTAEFSSITNADKDGLQLSGSGPVAISSTVFDLMGVAAGFNGYITARSLNSTADLNNVSFLTTRSTAGAGAAYNVRVEGSDAGLAWKFHGGSGALWGEAFDLDPTEKVLWGVDVPPGSPAIAAIGITSVSVSFQDVGASSYIIEAATASNFTGTLFRSSSSLSFLSPLAPQSLTANTTYYLRAGALWAGTTFYADAASSPAVTLTAAPGAVTFPAISATDFTASWASNNPSNTRFEVVVSTDVGFGVFTASASITATSRTFSGLAADATFFVRVRGVNHAGVPGDPALAAVVTRTGVVTVSANRLSGVWYNGNSTLFNAQGATNFRYRLSANPVEALSGADPLFDGSAILLGVPEGEIYFHVLGEGGAGDGQTARYGPIQIDTTAPLAPVVTVRTSMNDLTIVPDGGTTNWGIPRFLWTEPASASPIQGYSVSVANDAATDPDLTVAVTIPFADHVLASPGLKYVKVRALDRAGNWGAPSAARSFVYSTIPNAGGLTVKRSYFNPLRGECAEIVVLASQAGRQKIELYTLLGQRVATIVDENRPAGSYQYSWCGRTNRGSTVAVGAYLLHVEAPQQKREFYLVVAK